MALHELYGSALGQLQLALMPAASLCGDKSLHTERQIKGQDDIPGLPLLLGLG
jgi:hypothetical protein